jgi:hypothetical protein
MLPAERFLAQPAGFVFRHHLIRFRTASPQPPTS